MRPVSGADVLGLDEDLEVGPVGIDLSDGPVEIAVPGHVREDDAAVRRPGRLAGPLLARAEVRDRAPLTAVWPNREQVGGLVGGLIAADVVVAKPDEVLAGVPVDSSECADLGDVFRRSPAAALGTAHRDG